MTERLKGVSEWAEEDIRRALIQYLAEHPQAMDTLEGIAAWWLMRQQVRTEVTMLTKVLEQLVAERVLEEVGSGPSLRYRCGPKALEPGE